MNVRAIVPWFSGPGLGRADPFWPLQERMSRMLEDAFGPSLALSTPEKRLNGRASDFSPKLNVTESAECFTVSLEVPGISEKDIKISVKDRVLTVSGERKSGTESAKCAGACYCESSYGTFSRTIKLGEEIREDGIDAVLKNGVLSVILPKCPVEERAGKSIAVRAA